MKNRNRQPSRIRHNRSRQTDGFQLLNSKIWKRRLLMLATCHGLNSTKRFPSCSRSSRVHANMRSREHHWPRRSISGLSGSISGSNQGISVRRLRLRWQHTTHGRMYFRNKSRIGNPDGRTRLLDEWSPAVCTPASVWRCFTGSNRWTRRPAANAQSGMCPLVKVRTSGTCLGVLLGWLDRPIRMSRST